MSPERRSRADRPPTVTMQRIQTLRPDEVKTLKLMALPVFSVGIAILSAVAVGIVPYARVAVVVSAVFVVGGLFLVARPGQTIAFLWGLAERAIPERFLNRRDRRSS